MATFEHNRLPVKPYRRTHRPDAPFGQGIFPHPAGLSDAEQRAIDELKGDLDWLPEDVRLDENIDARYWGDYADWFVYNPTEEESRWAAETSPFANEFYDVVEALSRREDSVDRVQASMIDPAVARALAYGLVPLY